MRTYAMVAMLVVALAAVTGCQRDNGTGTIPTITSTTPPAASPSRPPAGLPGILFYLTQSDGVTTVAKVGPGGAVVRVTLPADPTSCVYNSVSVAPDGTHLAWIKGTADGQGDFYLADGAGSHAKKLHGGTVCFGATAIRWTEGTFVEARGTGGGKLDYGVDTGAPTQGDPGLEESAVWSANGKALVAHDLNDDANTFYSAIADGSGSYTFTYKPPADQAEHWDGWAPRSVSADARYVAVGWIGTDPSRRDDSFAVIDASTGKPVRLPVLGDLRHVEFLADGTVLVATATTFYLLDGHWTVKQETPAPSPSGTLIRYVP